MYIVDVLVIRLDGEDFNRLPHNVNALSNVIKLTVEWKDELNIPFLDASMHILPSGFSFALYREHILKFPQDKTAKENFVFCRRSFFAWVD